MDLVWPFHGLGPFELLFRAEFDNLSDPVLDAEKVASKDCDILRREDLLRVGLAGLCGELDDDAVGVDLDGVTLGLVDGDWED